MLARDHNMFFGPRSFNGTLHGLLLRCVVYPFAHLRGAEKGVRLWQGDWPTFGYLGDNNLRLALDQFRLKPDGSLVFARPALWARSRVDEVVDKIGEQILKRKRGFFRKQGILSTDDAMWIALRILREQPVVAAALAGRFDEILVDEAQDTSDLQLACLHEVRASGRLRSLVMVGDLEQSIYAYQGASAKVCRELAERSCLRTLTLDQNHRSSQKLCNVASHFSGREADKAVGPHRDCPIDPEVFLYPADDPEPAMDHFRARLEAHEIAHGAAAVLVRSNKMVARLGGHQELVKVDRMPKAVGALAAALAGGTLDRTDIWRAEALISRGAFDQHPTEIDPEVREQLRIATHRFIGDLPPLEGSLREWILGARTAYGAALARVSDQPKREASRLMKSSPKHVDFKVADVFVPAPSGLVPQTVHALKGEDREAVMVVVKKHHGNDRARQMQFLEAAFGESGVSEGEQEERRITYVALTRAERFCLFALPDNARGCALAQKCQEIGFVVP